MIPETALLCGVDVVEVFPVFKSFVSKPLDQQRNHSPFHLSLRRMYLNWRCEMIVVIRLQWVLIRLWLYIFDLIRNYLLLMAFCSLVCFWAPWFDTSVPWHPIFDNSQPCSLDREGREMIRISNNWKTTFCRLDLPLIAPFPLFHNPCTPLWYPDYQDNSRGTVQLFEPLD